MRLFLTSFQKSGTHQIMPALKILPNVVDRSCNSLRTAPALWEVRRTIDWDGMELTCKSLQDFKESAFGHVSYLPQYAEALQTEPTKVLFNVRDPRDVIVSEYYSIIKIIGSGKGKGFPNFCDENGKYLIEYDNPIQELIKLDATRWPHWLGWFKHDFVLKVRYEDLRLDSTNELNKIHDWLLPYEINVTACQHRLAPADGNPTFRRGVVGEWKDLFTDEHKKLSEELLGETIIKLGYEI